MKYYGAIEAGGTKFVCSIVADPDNYFEEIRFATTTPEETLQHSIRFFNEQQKKYKLEALGVSCFGPLDLDPASTTYGYITTTPKAGWQFTNVVGILQEALGLPVGFDTDVNGAALAEYRWGNPEGLQNLVYYTIGTGIGAGVLIDGKPVHGLVHPEAGHVLIRQDLKNDPFKGICPYHKTCLEGLCSGPAIQARFGVPAHDLPENHPFWDIFAYYIAQACVAQICQISPEKIILGGGVMQQTHLFPRIHKEVQRLLNGYVQHPLILEHIDQYITPPVLGNRSGACGAVMLAQRQMDKN